MKGSGGYVFGDGAREEARLRLVDEAFSGASRALLARACDVTPRVAYDVGCGTGVTSRLLSSVTGAASTVGLDCSQRQLVRARSDAPPGVSFARHDVTTIPFPNGLADLIYGRLVLAHVPEPTATARRWASQLEPGGRLVLDEIEWINARNPTLARHLELVDAMVATTGADMCVGPRLWRLAADHGLEEILAEVVECSVPTGLAARMFALSIGGWGRHAVELGLLDERDRAELCGALESLSSSEGTDEVKWGLHHAVYSSRG